MRVPPNRRGGEDQSLKTFYKAKNSCILTPYVDELLKTFGEYSLFYYHDERVRETLINYERLSEMLERRIIPESAKEFRHSIHYCIPSQLRKYTGFLPYARAVPGLEFNGE